MDHDLHKWTMEEIINPFHNGTFFQLDYKIVTIEEEKKDVNIEEITWWNDEKEDHVTEDSSSDTSGWSWW